MESIDLTFKYTQDEYVKAEKQFLFANKTITKQNIVFLAIYLPFSIWYLLFSSFSVLSIITFGVALICAIIGCTLYFYIPVHKFKQTSKYHEEYNLIFSKDCIRFKTSTTNSELSWSVFSEIWESKDFYFLVQVPRMRLYTLIPKRAFSGFSAKQAFEEIAFSNLKCTKRM